MKSVLVLGGGIAGTAAALEAARTGARVVLLGGGTGASTLATGALDDSPWTHAARPLLPVGRAARAILDALAAYAVPDGGARIATTAGVLRPARGHDLALLDLASLAGRRVGVVRCDRPEWDAGALARSWGAGFAPLDATVLRHADERLLPAADFAARHDDERRLAWLAERLRDALARAGSHLDALIVPSSLGVEAERARALSALVGLPCGEAAAAPGGPSGLRFERARDRALAAAGVVRAAGRATHVERRADRWHVARADGPALEAMAVVLAVGGFIGGGLEYSPGEAAEASVLPPASRPPFRLTIDVPAVELGARGRSLEVPGSLFGIPPESLAWPFATDPMMERVGVLVDEDGRAAPGLYAAGEMVPFSGSSATFFASLPVGSGGVAAPASASRTTMLFGLVSAPPEPV